MKWAVTGNVRARVCPPARQPPTSKAYATVPSIERSLQAAADRRERKRAEAALRQQDEERCLHNEELERFNRAVVGREVRMIELKAEINGLLKAAGQPDKYKIIEEDA